MAEEATLLTSEGRAKWAETFRPSDTNLVQRARHNADIAGYTAKLQAAQEAHQEQEARTSSVAQGFWFKSKELEAREKERPMELKRKEELHQATLANKFASTAAAHELQLSRETTRTALAEQAKVKGADTTAFSKGMMELLKTEKPHTSKYEEGMLALRAKHGSMESSVFDDWFKSGTNSKLTPEEAVDAYARTQAALNKQGALPGTTVQVGPSGTTITSKPVNVLGSLEKQQKFEANEVRLALARRDKKIQGEPEWLEYDADAKRLQDKLSETESELDGVRKGTATPTVPTTAGTESGPVVIKGAEDWNALPTGAEFIDPNGVKRRK